MYPRALAMLLVMFLFLPSSPTIIAQNKAMGCSALVQQALTDLDKNCRNINNGTACYGHKRVQVAIPDTSETLSFENTGDRVPISGLQTITSSPVDTTSGDWGIAILNINDVHTSLSAHMVLVGDAAVDNINTESQLPIQNINLRTGSSVGQCAEAPSMVVLQSQTDVVVNLTVNNSLIRVAGLVVFQQQSTNMLTGTVQSGQLAIGGGPILPAEHTIVGVMDNSRNILFWSAPRSSNSDELRVANLAANIFGRIGVITVPVESPPPTSTSTPIPDATATPSPTCRNNITHVVERGENLFRIALRYGTTVEAIMAANGISHRDQISAGQKLVIPCAVDNGTNSESENNAQTIDCKTIAANLPANMSPELQNQLNWLCQSP